MTQNLRADFHIHSNQSIDARNSIDEMCRAAVDKGFSIVCFTEHYDLNPKEKGHHYLNFEGYAEDIERARDSYSDRLLILKGIEFGEPHLYRREFEDVLKRDFDFILASVHSVGDFGAFWLKEVRRAMTASTGEFFEFYYGMVLKMVDYGGFDAVAHLDFPKRYFETFHEPPGLLEEICEKLVRKNISLELNSKPLELGFSELNPSNAICALYAQKGGVKVTVGSDAHKVESIGAHFEIVSEVIENFGFRPVGFEKRKEFGLIQ